jgi:transferase CAF17, mitochondrial
MQDYTIKRILSGIPEGPSDLFYNASLPLESNLDYMDGGELTLSLIVFIRIINTQSSGFQKRMLSGTGIDHSHLSYRSDAQENCACAVLPSWQVLTACLSI